MKPVEKIEVIRTDLLVRGKGTEEDPIRTIEQFWSLDGFLLFEKDLINDPHRNNKLFPEKSLSE